MIVARHLRDTLPNLESLIEYYTKTVQQIDVGVLFLEQPQNKEFSDGLGEIKARLNELFSIMKGSQTTNISATEPSTATANKKIRKSVKKNKKTQKQKEFTLVIEWYEARDSQVTRDQFCKERDLKIRKNKKGKTIYPDLEATQRSVNRTIAEYYDSLASATPMKLFCDDTGIAEQQLNIALSNHKKRSAK
jgi:hypothetical protein